MPISGTLPSGGSKISERRQAQAEARYAAYSRRQLQLTEKQQKLQAAAAAAEEERFQQHLAQVTDAVQQRSGVLGEVDALLEAQAHVKARQQRQMYEQWSQQVFEQIQGRIQEQLATRSPRQISDRLHAASSAYVSACNRKLGVFRDVVIAEDYDPLAPVAAAIVVPTGDLLDPLEGDLLRTRLELKQLGLSSSAPSSPGRVVLDPLHWGGQDLLATPYGHCVAPDGTYRVRPASEAAARSAASHLHMDHYSVPREPDFEVSGRRAAPGRAGKSAVEDILKARPLQPGEGTAGDMWLAAKGKKALEGPEARQGRRGLFDVLQQSSNPYKDGRALGDAWLASAKGKKPVPGPEARRGRANLFDVLQQAPAPAVRLPGQVTGDAWLDARGRRTGKQPTASTKA